MVSTEADKMALPTEEVNNVDHSMRPNMVPSVLAARHHQLVLPHNHDLSPSLLRDPQYFFNGFGPNGQRANSGLLVLGSGDGEAS